MNYLEKLLQGAPVEWKTLGEVAKVNKGVQLNKTLLKESGKYPAYNGGKTYSGWTDSYNVEENTIIISQGGASAGFVNFITTKFWANAHCYYVIPNEVVENHYLYHFLKMNEMNFMGKQHGAGIPALAATKLKTLEIPIPPLSVQREIARILDAFTAITSELTSELTLRQKQYQHYRDQLLTFGDEVEWKTLGEVANFSQGIQVGVSDQFFEPREDLIRFLRIVDFVKLDEPPRYIKKPDNKYIKKYGDLIMIRYGASSAGKVFFNNSGAIANNTFKINIEHKALTNKFLFYYLSQPSIYSYLNNSSGKSTMPAITFNQVGSIKIPIPSIIEQQRIVSILDKFEMLTNSLSDGLPKEIELRQKQYAYYRDLLLGFENSTL
ncbi:hypothetical protein JP31_00220 [Gallibacterium anatis]|uniref:restriction endonuclease subunit S n=1 Tax=Gallibacterium anatis TaxID=750 RepID=UPI00053185B7|nr:restriction endonuclease subunit S [Gallibacterium anatis]KGQ28954.1 hypothetical protein JP31_00220 [Gallibacterium anatis]